MTALRKAAQQALAALETPIHEQSFMQRRDVLAALRAALEQEQEQEPVGWASKRGLARIKDFDATLYSHGGFADAVALYTAPPRREWVSLTEEESDCMTVRVQRDAFLKEAAERFARSPLTDEEIKSAAESEPFAVYELMRGHEITAERFRHALNTFARAIERKIRGEKE
jgi:hypothetical protein